MTETHPAVRLRILAHHLRRLAEGVERAALLNDPEHTTDRAGQYIAPTAGAESIRRLRELADEYADLGDRAAYTGAATPA